MSDPESMVYLIEAFAKLPGVGSRTAERFAMYILSAPPEEVEVVRLMVKQEMESVRRLSVPLIADVGIGDNWRDAK